MSKFLSIKTAVLSVWDKEGILPLARSLVASGTKIYASGGTYKALSDSSIACQSMEEITSAPELFHGRMKTLSFPFLSGILFDRDVEQDCQDVKKHNIHPIDLVVCNFYPFPAGGEECPIDLIDIGGPTMVRAAAKNFEHVSCLTSPAQYEAFISEFENNHGKISRPLRQQLASQAFAMTWQYEENIALAFAGQKLRYGENPAQKALLLTHGEVGLAGARILQGKEMSYNNFLDGDAALATTLDLNALCKKGEFAAVIVKHTNPCGAAIATNPSQALLRAWEGDPVSAFGGIVCFNFVVGKEIATTLREKFIEVVIAPGFDHDALEILASKKNLRLVEIGNEYFSRAYGSHLQKRSISGGTLFQTPDVILKSEIQSVSKLPVPQEKLELCHFTMTLAKHLRSNAIALAHENSLDQYEREVWLVGAGMGNPNRLLSLQQALSKAQENGIKDLSRVCLASDAFFPFKDCLELSALAGIRLVVAPGGSIRDQEVIDEANSKGVALGFIGERHFKH